MMVETHPRLFYTLVLVLALLALSCALLAPPVRAADVQLHARLTNDQGAEIRWTQPAGAEGLTCLYHKRSPAPAVLYTCWSGLPAGPIRTVIHPPFDAAQRPSLGSEYILTQANVVVSRAFVVAPVYLPVARG